MEVRLSNLPSRRWSDGIVSHYLRFAAGGRVAASRYLPVLLPLERRRSVEGRLEIEIVSHCWRYAHFLALQLGSIVRFPPEKASVVFTVYYSSDDVDTVAVLDFFGAHAVENVTWNWRALQKEQLFRRAIGRNHAARHTAADWIWFTDCDLMFRRRCLDTLAERLQGRRDALLYPRYELVTPLLPDDHPLLNTPVGESIDVPIDRGSFYPLERTRATGPLQIVHGDVAREHGYCANLPLYQTPATSWCKAYEDRAFRWLLRSPGVPVDVPGVYRIRHASKGRYAKGRLSGTVRGAIRRLGSWLLELRHRR